MPPWPPFRQRLQSAVRGGIENRGKVFVLSKSAYFSENKQGMNLSHNGTQKSPKKNAHDKP